MLVWLAAASSAFCTDYYVRPDGGNAQQCLGTVDSPFPGSGSAMPCAWAHPFWAVDEAGNWKLQGGDALIVREGSYMLGYGAPNTNWCTAPGAFACTLPPLPSGPSAQKPTRVLGAGHQSGCRRAPELWGTQRAWNLLDLRGTSNAVVDCLELTDHSGCVEFHSDPAAHCQRDSYPFGDWASVGIVASDSSNVILRNLNIHGFAHTGVQAGRLTDWTVENVRLAANGWVGWDGDIPGDDSNSGVLRFKRWLVEWNGCAETYPEQHPDHCWAQSAGGYGDGVGTGATGGHWIIEDSVFRYNTSDGLDLLYVNNPTALVEVARSVSLGNAGNQMKISGASRIVNSLLVGNCGFFFGKSYAAAMGPRDSGDHCRALGNTLAISLFGGVSSAVTNCTVVGEGDVLVSAECGWTGCAGSESLTLKNNIFLGNPDFTQPGDTTALLWSPGIQTSGKIDYNVVRGIKNNGGQCRNGPNDLCADPLFISSTLGSFDGHLRPGSPAIDSGLPAGEPVPVDDLEGTPRPSGRGVDRGAYEDPTGNCSFTIGRAASGIDPLGGTYSESVGTQAGCAWRATASPDWVTLVSPSGTGAGLAQFSAAANGSSNPRTGAVVVAGERTALIQKSANPAQVFGDVPLSDSFAPYIDLLRQYEVTKGCSASGFCPDDTTTRGQLAVFLVRARFGGDTFPYPAVPYFRDVLPSHPFFRHIQKLKDMGITSGCATDLFCPESLVTRGQLAALAVRARLGIPAGQDFSYPATPYFQDVPPAHAFFPFIQKFRQLGITLGCSAVEFCPDTPTTRAQMAVFLIRSFFTP
jgi:hypothetical protein